MSSWLPAAFSVCLAIPLAVPSLLSAQELGSEAGPATHPSHRDGHGREHLGTYSSNTEPLTPDERVAAEKFMQENSPKRWEKLQKVREDHKINVLRLVRNNMRMLNKLKADDPKIYELRMKRLPIEDEMFSIAWRLKHEDNANAADLRKSLHEEVQQFVENSLAERQLHIERMQDRLHKQQQELEQSQNQLAQAQAKLKKDLDGKDTVIDQGVADIENERGGDLRDLAAPLLNPRKSDGSNSAATQPSANNSADSTP